MYPGDQKPVVTIREVRNGFVVCHSYSISQLPLGSKYYSDEYVFDCKEDAIDLANDLL